MTTPSCMGGFCSFRDRCERHTTDDRRNPAERLCAKGEEGSYRLISFRTVGQWERTTDAGLLRAAQPFDGITA